MTKATSISLYPNAALANFYNTQTPTLAQGTGRTLDYLWPVPQFVTEGSNPPVVGWSRYGAQRSGVWTYGEAGVPPAGKGATVYKGRVCYKFTCSALGAISIEANTGANRFQVNSRTGDGAPLGPFSCWRIRAIVAMVGFNDYGGGSGDLGLEITLRDAASQMMTAGFQGILIRPQNTEQFRLLVRRSNQGPFDPPTDFSEICPLVCNVAEWNALDLVFVSATETEPGFMGMAINGRPQFTIPYEQNIIPDGASLKPCLVAREGNPATLWIAAGSGLQLAAGPSELAVR